VVVVAGMVAVVAVVGTVVVAVVGMVAVVAVVDTVVVAVAGMVAVVLGVRSQDYTDFDLCFFLPFSFLNAPSFLSKNSVVVFCITSSCVTKK